MQTSPARTGGFDAAEAAQLRCAPHTLILASRQLSVLLRSGVPLVRSLEVVGGNPDPGFQRCIEMVLLQVNSGQRLSACFSRFPLIFPRVYTVMVRIGETTGALVNCLELLASWIEREDTLRVRFIKALTYPILVLVVTILLTGAVVWLVIPPFMTMFREASMALPLPTKVLMLVTDGARSPLAWIVGLLVLGSYGVTMKRRWSTEDGACDLYRWLARIPVVGYLVTCVGVARWSLSLSAMLEAGVDIQTALKLSGQASGDPRLARDSALACKTIQNGQTLSEHLAQDRLYPRTVMQLVQAGEEASRVGQMLARCADIYGQEVEYQVDLLSATLEPLLLTLVSSIVGFVLVAIFLPMYSFVDKL